MDLYTAWRPHARTLSFLSLAIANLKGSQPGNKWTRTNYIIVLASLGIDTDAGDIKA